jgi:hypothetical protein
MKPKVAPIATANDPVAVLQDEGRVGRLDAPLHERLQHEPNGSQHERSADRVGLGRLHALAVSVLEMARCPDPEERHRPRAEEHPERQTSVHRSESPVPNGPERLEHRSVEDVRADGVRRLEAEQNHEDGREQRSAAHPGQADEHADEQPRERELPGHLAAAIGLDQNLGDLRTGELLRR